MGGISGISATEVRDIIGVHVSRNGGVFMLFDQIPVLLVHGVARAPTYPGAGDMAFVSSSCFA